MLFDRREFIYRHGMEQIFSDFILSRSSFRTFLLKKSTKRFILSHVSFAPFLYPGKEHTEYLETFIYYRKVAIIFII
jgi:hypothetical protein